MAETRPFGRKQIKPISWKTKSLTSAEQYSVINGFVYFPSFNKTFH
jgi:hypothetical protein